MNCNACQAQIPDNSKFCSTCGAKQSLLCPGCGAEIQAGQRFCSECGHRLGDAPSTPAPTPASAPVRGTGSLAAPGAESSSKADAGDRRVVTVLFTDVSGFTSMSEKLDPEEVTEIVNQFFSVLTQPIYKYGGVVDKYIGDAIMALFGAPVAHEDDPLRAVSAAWEMQVAAKEYAAKLFTRTGIQLRIRVGLNTGLVVAGAVGGAQKQDYTVMGDTVNLAQRMESNAQLGGVLVTQETYKLTMDAFEFTEREPVKVKGKEEPVKVYDLVGPLSKRNPAGGAKHCFVGRQGEMDRLDLCLENALKGQPQLVFISGEAGIGKTRLISEFVAKTNQRWPIVRGRCPSWAQEASYALIANTLNQWLDLSSNALSTDIQRRLKDACALYGQEDPERTVALLGYLLSVDIPHPEVAGLSPQQKRSAAFLALNDLLVRVIAQNPLILIFDDLHWVDEASLEWLRTFVERVGTLETPPRLLLVMQHRPTTDRNLGDWGDRLDLSRIRLRPFSGEEALEVISDLVQEAHASWSSPLRQLMGQVATRAEGNPLYLIELVHALQDAKVVVAGPQGLQVTAMKSGLTLPSTINGVVASRLDMLKPSLRSMLQVASVVGRSFHPQLLSQIYPIGGLDEILQELVKAEFIYLRNSGEYAFSQVIIQEVAYQSLLLSSRRRLHHLLGTTMEKMLGARVEEQSKLLAYHWSRAEEPSKSCHYLFLAGERAKRNFSNMEAISCYKQSLEWLQKSTNPENAPTQPEILAALAEVEMTMGTYPQAQAHLEEALALTEMPIDKAKIYYALGQNYERRGDYEAALLQCEAGITLLAGQGGLELAKLLNEKGWLKYCQGDYQGCIQTNQEALTHLNNTSFRREIARSYSDIGVSLYRLNHFHQAIESHKAALKLREEASDIQGMAISLHNLGIVYYETGEWDTAADNYRKTLEIYQKIGDPIYISHSQLSLGDLLCNQGKLEEAEQYLRQTLELNRRLSNNYMIGFALCGIGNVISYAGRYDEAVSVLKEGLAILESLEAVDLLAEVNQILGRVYLGAGNPAECQKSLTAGMNLARSTKNMLQVGVIQRLFASEHLQAGRLEDAQAAIRESLSILETIGSKLELARAQWVAMEVHQTSGEAEKAQGLREQAIATFKQLNAGWDLAQAEQPANA